MLPVSQHELHALALVLKDPVFERWYRSNRRHIPQLTFKPIDGKNGLSSPYFMRQGGRFTIHLPRVPAAQSDAYVVAHEMTHCQLTHRGYPGATVKQWTITDMCAAYLTCLLQDPMIDQRLRSYGFAVPDAPAWPIPDAAPDTRRGLAQWVMLGAMMQLDWNLSGRAGQCPNMARLALKHASIAHEVHALVGFIRTNHFSTQDQHRAILQHVVDTYGLSDIEVQ